MKKCGIILSFLIVLLLFSSFSIAAKNYSYTTITIDGKKQSVSTVPVLVDGQAINSDVPPFIYKDYTMVPIRFVAESLGSEVSWNGKNKTVTINDSKKQIVLGINSSYVYINGQKQKLPNGVPSPKLVNTSNANYSRTMIPLRFVSETLGHNVKWDNEKRIAYIEKNKDIDKEINETEINSITVDSNSNIKISASSTFKYQATDLTNPSRIVIDIPDTKLNLKDGSKFDENGIVNISVGKTYVDKISASQFSTNPSITRIVIHLNENVEYKIVSAKDEKSIEIGFTRLNKVENLKMETINGQEAIVIYNSLNSRTNTLKLSNPNRIVLDILDSTVDLEKQISYDYQLGIIKNVRVSQFSPDSLYKPDDKVVRVVFDIKDGINDPNIKISSDGNRIIVMPDKNPWEGIKYENNGSEKIFSIMAKNETRYTTNYDTLRKIMEINIPKENANLTNGTINVNDNFIDRIVISDNSGNSKVEIYFKKSIEYAVLSKEVDSEIKIKFARDSQIEPKERLIVIDPGHGGKDPGAISQNGYYEKNVTISIANKLNDRLRELGYNTEMTRYDDTYLGLYDRTDIANKINADIFVSIHSNAHNDKSISGLQTLYHPSKKEGDGSSYQLAKMIHEEVLKSTGFQDKKMVERPNLAVLRTSNMPAALIEVGFISNLEDEKLITNSEFQDRVVDGIIKGIERYFAEY